MRRIYVLVGDEFVEKWEDVSAGRERDQGDIESEEDESTKTSAEDYQIDRDDGTDDENASKLLHRPPQIRTNVQEKSHEKVQTSPLVKPFFVRKSPKIDIRLTKKHRSKASRPVAFMSLKNARRKKRPASVGAEDCKRAKWMQTSISEDSAPAAWANVVEGADSYGMALYRIDTADTNSDDTVDTKSEKNDFARNVKTPSKVHDQVPRESPVEPDRRETIYPAPTMLLLSPVALLSLAAVGDKVYTEFPGNFVKIYEGELEKKHSTGGWTVFYEEDKSRYYQTFDPKSRVTSAWYMRNARCTPQEAQQRRPETCDREYSIELQPERATAAGLPSKARVPESFVDFREPVKDPTSKRALEEMVQIARERVEVARVVQEAARVAHMSAMFARKAAGTARKCTVVAECERVERDRAEAKKKRTVPSSSPDDARADRTRKRALEDTSKTGKKKKRKWVTKKVKVIRRIRRKKMRAERNEVVRTACKRAKMARVERERAEVKKKQIIPISSADDAGVDSHEICSQDLPELFTTEEAEEKRKSRKRKRVGFDLTRNEVRLVPRWDKVYNEAEAQRIAAEEAQRKAEAEARRRSRNSRSRPHDHSSDFRPVCHDFLDGRCVLGGRCSNAHPPNFAPTSANAVPVGIEDPGRVFHNATASDAQLSSS
eukprot:g1076.t1